MYQLKRKGAPASGRKLSLEVFQEKRLGEVHEIKGGTSIPCVIITKEIIEEVVETIVDNCHD